MTSTHARVTARLTALALVVGAVAVLAPASVQAAPTRPAAPVNHVISTLPARDRLEAAPVVPATPTPWDSVVAGYQPVASQRVLDTAAGGGAPLAAATTRTMDVRTALGVPTVDVDGVALRITARSLTTKTGVTVWDGATTQPAPANLAVAAVAAGATTTQVVVVPLSLGGLVSLRSSAAAVHVAVDLIGYVPDASGLTPLRSLAVLNTATGKGASGPMTAGSTLTIPIAGVGRVPDTGVAAVLLDVTVTNPSVATRLTAFATGTSRPAVADLEARNGRATSGLLAVPVGADGSVSLYNQLGNATVNAEIVGWFAAGVDYQPLIKATLRTGAATGVADVPVAGVGGVPASGVGAVVVDLHTVTGAAAATASLWPSGADQPAAADQSLAANSRGNVLTIVPLGADGHIQVAVSAAVTEATVSVVGYYSLAMLPPANSTWEFRPTPNVMLSASNSRVLTHLENVDADGNPTGAYLPAGTRWVTSGDASAVKFEVLGRGRARATATSVIGALGVTITPPNGAQGRPFVATNARVKAGVVKVPDSRVIFPSTAPGGGSYAPFTLAEINARIAAPTGQSTDPWGSSGHIPVVLSGVPPVNGRLLVASGDSGVTGRVVSTAALPSLSRGGYSLITLQPVSPADVFQQLRFDVPLDGTGVLGIAPAALTPDKSSRRARRLQFTPPTPGECVPTGTLAVSEFKGANVEFPIPKVSLNWAAVIIDGELNSLRGDFAFSATASAEVIATVQGTGQVNVTCDLLNFGQIDVPAGGPFSGLLTGTIHPYLTVESELTLKGGPKMEAKVKCEAEFTTGFTFRYNTNEGLLTTTAPTTKKAACTPTFTPTITGDGMDQAKVEAKVGAYLNLAVGGRFFGLITSRIGWAIGKEDLGVLELVNFKVGPQWKTEWENDAMVRVNKKAASKSVIEANFQATVGLLSLEKMIAKLTNVEVSLSITLFEVTAGLFSLYRVPDDGQPVVSVNGAVVQPAAGGFYDIRPGDSVAVESPMTLANQGIQLMADPPVEGGTDWIETTPQAFQRLNLFTITPGSTTPSLHATASITPATCLQFGPTGKAVDFLATTHMFGVAPTSGWAGQLVFRCAGPELTFDPTTVAFGPQETTSTKTVNLTSKNARQLDWSIQADTVPAWLTVSPMSGTFENDPDSAPLAVRVNCDAVAGGATTSAVVTAAVIDVFDRRTETSFSVTVDCTKDFIRVDPAEQQGGGTVNVVSNGALPDSWTVSDVPAWATLTPTSRNLSAGNTSQSVQIKIDQREPKCQRQGERSATITFTTTHRGTDTLRLVDPPVDPVTPCPKPSSWGDPHLMTSDGLWFDAQVLGEYVYLQSAADNGASFMVQARHQLTDPLFLNGATSITALAVRSSGHVVEVYSRPEAVYLDGVPMLLDYAVPFAITDQMWVTRTGSLVQITTPEGVITADIWRSIINMDVAFDGAANMVGLLGRPDGNPANDLTPRGAATSFTVEQVRGHTPQLYQLTDSWRLTNVADSLFTQHYADFAEVNAPMSEALLAPFRQQAFDALGNITRICGGSTPVAGDYVVEQLAVELATGRDVGDLGRFTCKYEVTGYANTAGEAYGVAGLQITVDANGLTPCTVTSGLDGSYRCILTPALDELAGVDPGQPIMLHADARWPGDAVPQATADVPTAGRAPLQGLPLHTTVPLEIQMDLPGVAVNGHLTDTDGSGVTPRWMTLTGYDAANHGTGQTWVWVTPNAADGAYSFNKLLPQGTVRVVLDAQPPNLEHVQHEVTGLTAGVLTPATFDIAYVPAHLTVSGTVTLDGAPVTGTQYLSVTERNAAGAGVHTQFVGFTVNPATGAYSVPLTLFLAADHVDVSTIVLVPNGPGAFFSATATGIVPGANATVQLDAHAAPPRIHVNGTLQRNGAPVTSPARLNVFAYDAANVRVYENYFQYVTVDPATGAYTLDIALPHGSVRATVQAPLSPFGPEWLTLELAGLQPSATATGQLSGDYDPATVHISGEARVYGQLLSVGGSVMVEVTPFGADGNAITYGSWSNWVAVDASGHYAADVTLPAGTVKFGVRATPESAAGQGALQAVEVTNVVHSNVVTLDLDSLGIHVFGHYEGPPNDGTTLFSLIGFVGEGVVSGTSGYVAIDGTGHYDILQPMPLGTERVQMYFFDRAEAYNLTPTPGMNEWHLDVVNPTAPTNVTVHGSTTSGGTPLQDVTTISLDVVAYSVNTSSGHYAELERHTFTDVPIAADGSYSVATPVDGMTDMVRVLVSVPGAVGTPWQTAVSVTHSATVDIPYDIELDHFFMYTGQTERYSNCASQEPQLAEVDIYSLSPTGDFDVPTDSWTGGTKIGTALVVFEADGSWILLTRLPDGVTSIGLALHWSRVWDPTREAKMVQRFDGMPVSGSISTGDYTMLYC